MKGVHGVFEDYNDIELYINYMDTKRCSDSIYFEQLKNLYAHKYKNVSFNAIISTDDHALDFLLQYRDSIFPDVPVVFCGINDYKPSRIKGHNFFTGLYEAYDVKGTIDLILKLHPNTTKLAVISDATVSGQAFNDRLQRIEPQYKDLLKFKYFTNLTPSEITKELQALSENTIVIWSIYIRKPDGSVFTIEESVRFVTTRTTQPVYCVWDVVGHGVVGGKITDPVYQGKRSAEITMNLLQGINISEIPVEGSPLIYKFDFELLKDFNISESDLPDNSIVINRVNTFYQQYSKQIIGVASLIVFLVLIVLVLMYLVQKQKQAQQEIFVKNLHLEETSKMLKTTNEKLTKALEIAKKSKELESANKKLLENEKLQKKLNEELRILNLTKDKFFAIIAHDLRSPFNSILGVTNLLRKDYDNYNVKEQKELINVINKTIYKTYKLLENLLLWSSSQSGNMEFNPIEFNLWCLVNDTLDVLAQSARNKSITIENNIPDDLQLNADTDMLSTIIRNLISNAIKYTERGGEIKLNASVASSDVHDVIKISVSDTGVGISEDVQSKLFDLNNSSSTVGTEKETGTGLGLILCKEFVEMHKGHIWVESELGRGSEFIFTIPNSA